MNANDERFATEAIRRGFITISTLDEAKTVQKQLAEMGINEPIAEILVKRNYMTRAQADAILSGGKSDGKFVIPGYQVTARIGSGGMGTVYKAIQLSINRPVAIKVLSEKLGGDPQYAERFAREARNLAKLNHVNIVSAIDAGVVGKVMYFVMEYIEGESLGDVIKRRKRLPEAEALHVAIQAVRALDHANAHGIIHRDIKPDNILITKDGIAKLTDLGLAKTKGEDANLTQTGIAIGTPNYISPEQARGERDLDTRGDIYSMGATLYHMVVGEAPFKGSSALEVVTKHLTEQLPSPKISNPALSEGICIVIEKMMAKRREDRYQTPQDLLADLELVTDGKMPKARRPSGMTTRTTVKPPVFRAPAGSAGAARATRRPSPVGRKSSPVPALAAVGGGLLLVVVLVFALSGKDRRDETPERRHETPLVVKKEPPIPQKSAQKIDEPSSKPPRDEHPDRPRETDDTPKPAPPVVPRDPWRPEAERIAAGVRVLLLQGEYRKAAEELGRLTALKTAHKEMTFDEEQTLRTDIERQSDKRLGDQRENVQTRIGQSLTEGEYEALKRDLEADRRRQLPKNDLAVGDLIAKVDAKLADLRRIRRNQEEMAAGERKLLAEAWKSRVTPLLEKWDFAGAAKTLENEMRITSTSAVRTEAETLLSSIRKVDGLLTGLWDQKKIDINGVEWELLIGSKGERYVRIRGNRTDMRRDKEESRDFLEQIIRKKMNGFPENMTKDDREALAFFYVSNGDRKTAAAVASKDPAVAEKTALIDKLGLAIPAPKVEDLFAYARTPKLDAAVAPQPGQKPSPASKKRGVELISGGKFEENAEAKEYRKFIEENGTSAEDYLQFVKEHKYDEIRNIIYQTSSGYLALSRRNSRQRQIPPQYVIVGDTGMKDCAVDMEARLKLLPEEFERGVEVWFRADEEFRNGILALLKPRVAVEIEKEKGKARLKIDKEELEKLLRKEISVDITISVVKGGDRDLLDESKATLKGDEDFHLFQWKIEGDRLELSMDRKPLASHTDRDKKFPKEGRMAFGIPTGRMGGVPEEFGIHVKNLSYTSK